jgi:hypothetical protein
LANTLVFGNGSREKIRPEQELQRAESQVLHSKLAIREAIHELDKLGFEGSLKDSAFDAEGCIYHEEVSKQAPQPTVTLHHVYYTSLRMLIFPVRMRMHVVRFLHVCMCADFIPSRSEVKQALGTILC